MKTSILQVPQDLFELLEDRPGKPVEGAFLDSSGSISPKNVETFVRRQVERGGVCLYEQYEVQNYIARNPRYMHMLSPTAKFLLELPASENMTNLVKTPRARSLSCDTADLVIWDKFCQGVVNVKSISPRAANSNSLIAAKKTLLFCHLLKTFEDFRRVNFWYVGVEWEAKGKTPWCNKIGVYDLFKEDPTSLNVGTHNHVLKSCVSTWKQDFKEGRNVWADVMIDHIKAKDKVIFKKAQEDLPSYLRYFSKAV